MPSRPNLPCNTHTQTQTHTERINPIPDCLGLLPYFFLDQTHTRTNPSQLNISKTLKETSFVKSEGCFDVKMLLLHGSDVVTTVGRFSPKM